MFCLCRSPRLLRLISCYLRLLAHFSTLPAAPVELRLQLVRFLSQKQILLVLDNFEHLLEGVNILTDILEADPAVKFLATSRERLNVQEEWVLPIDGLRFPDVKSNEPLENYSAVQLFAQRARQVQANFSLSDNAEAVRSICQRVRGMRLQSTGGELAACHVLRADRRPARAQPRLSDDADAQSPRTTSQSACCL